MSAAVSLSNTRRPSPVQKGQCVKPQPPQEATLVSSMADLVQDVLPQPSAPSASLGPHKDSERVIWVSFQSADITDVRWQRLLKDTTGCVPPLIAVLGLARGYQVWALTANGDCEELVSDRQGPVRTAVLLPHPETSFGIETDNFGSSRPLMAVVDSVCLVPERQFCSVGLISLSSASQVHLLRYDDPVCALQATTKALLVQFAHKLVVCDALTFSQQIVIRGCLRSDDPSLPIPATLGDVWIAYADIKMNGSYRSCGGVSLDDSFSSYASQMMTAAKSIGKTVTAFGESVVSSLSSSPHSKSPPSLSAIQPTNPGWLTVIDIDRFDKSHESIHEDDKLPGIVSHFMAHSDEQVGYMKFAAGGSLLLTGGQSGQCFHLFSLFPHPVTPTFGAVHHLYTLFRGTTPAKVLDATFSEDNRWLAVATNHGTTHVFTITPYGGSITMRTHGDRLVNRESRFHKTAGLDSMEQTGDGGIGEQTHPSMASSRPIYRSVINPRLPPYPHPVILQAVAKIRQRFLSAENLSAWASDVTSLSSSKRTSSISSLNSSRLSSSLDSHRLAVVFAFQRPWPILPASSDSRKLMGLFVSSHDGTLTEYRLTVKPQALVAGAKVSAESPVQVTVAAVAQWTLSRTKSSPDLRPPLAEMNPLIVGARMAKNGVNGHKMKQKTVQEDATDTHDDLQCLSWVSQVEMVTYGGPARRLWMGPQFSFRTYLDSPEHSSSAHLLSPSSDTKRPSSSPMSTPSHRPVHSVVIEATSVGGFDFDLEDRGEGAGSRVKERQRAGRTREVCGSWSDNDYISCDEQEGRLRENIAEAMKEETNLCSSRPSTAGLASVPVVFPVECTDDGDDPSHMEDARSDFSSESPSHDSLQFSSMDA